MNYDFTLDKKGMFSVLVSSVLMGALLFVAGLIVGSYWTANGPTVSAAAARKNSADKELNSLAQEPVRMTELPQTNLPALDKPAVSLNSETTKPGALTAPQLPQAMPQLSTGAQPQAAAAPEQGDDNKAANASGDNAEKQSAKPEESSTASQASSSSDLVTVEVGAFLDANAANHLFKSLERKGYAPTFFTGRDAQSREWYSIRIGAYSDRQQAENAAANLAKQEKMKAVVRPLGSL
jgi:cell division septation protein DedD